MNVVRRQIGDTLNNHEDRVRNEYMFFFRARSRNEEKDFEKNHVLVQTVEPKREIFRIGVFACSIYNWGDALPGFAKFILSSSAASAAAGSFYFSGFYYYRVWFYFWAILPTNFARNDQL